MVRRLDGRARSGGRSRQTERRYFTLIYSGSGTLQWERGYPSLPEAIGAYERLLVAVIDGRVDPAQPVFRQDLED